MPPAQLTAGTLYWIVLAPIFGSQGSIGAHGAGVEISYYYSADGVSWDGTAATEVWIARFYGDTCSLTERTTLIGLTCGAFLGSSAVFFRGAALSLGDGPAIMRAAFALAVALLMQTVIMSVYLRLREPGQISTVFRNWQPSLMVGIAGVLASICWFTAFALQNAASVAGTFLTTDVAIAEIPYDRDEEKK